MKHQCVSHICALPTCERGKGLTVCPPVSSHVPPLAWPPHACQCHGVWATLPGSRVQQASKTNTSFKHYSQKDPGRVFRPRRRSGDIHVIDEHTANTGYLNGASVSGQESSVEFHLSLPTFAPQPERGPITVLWDDQTHNISEIRSLRTFEIGVETSKKKKKKKNPRKGNVEWQMFNVCRFKLLVEASNCDSQRHRVPST